MKHFLKRALCIFLCVFVASSSFLSVAANASSYPEGVTEKEALNALEGTKKLLDQLLPMISQQDLLAMFKGSIYNSKTLSDFLVNTYGSLAENTDELKLLGIDCSTKALSAALFNYPKVCLALYESETWADADLTNVDWGVKNKEEFAQAISAIFSPFNEILYTLLCSEGYQMNGILLMKGANGYGSSIIPFLQAVQCKDVIDQATFGAQAQEDKNSMIKNIVLPVLTAIEVAFEDPLNGLIDILPSLAYFIDSGELNACIQNLITPITKNPLVELAVLLKVFDMSALTNLDFSQLLTTMVSGKDSAIKLAPVDFSVFAACGEKTENGFVTDRGKAYIEILRVAIDSLKLNKDALSTFLASGENGESIDVSFLTQLLEKDTDKLVAMITLLFTPAEVGAPQAMVYPTFTRGTVQNTTSLTDRNIEKVYNEIDGLLDQFVAEGGSYGNMGAMLASSIYTNANINSALVGIYAAFENEGLTQALGILGVDATPKGVATLLGEKDYSKAREILSNAEKWSDVSLDGVSWGFWNGSRRGFQNALTAILRPLYPLLRVVLAEQDIVIMDCITIKGDDGYNTAIIPVLEALGCNERNIKDYDSYKKQADGDGVIKNILDPVFNLLDNVCNTPVKTIIEVLPNIVYFMESGSLEKCISNLLLPITTVINRVPGVIDFSLDTTALTKNLDMNTLAGSLMKDSGINIADFNIKEISKLGTPTQRTSKSIINGEKAKYTYIEANENDIIVSLLKVVAKTLKTPGNEELLMGSMASGSNMSFDTSSISAQFSTMSDDELVAWLYNLFFKERVQFEIVTDEEDYSPTIIYKPAEKDYTLLYLFMGYLGVCAVVGFIIFINRTRLYN